MPTHTIGLRPSAEPLSVPSCAFFSSTAIERWICAMRSSTSSSGPSTDSSTARASSSRPFATRYRGDSGMRRARMP
ncbi:Uncharacterised protein [Mycobacteroides abscessus]|nr:Uncharacterised protein [Mycobacteroides abscessus]